MLKTKHILLASLAGSFATGCSPNTPTEIVPGVTTQIQVPKAIKGVGLVVQAGGRLVSCEYVDAAGGVAILPGTVGVLKAEESAANDPVTTTVLGFQTPQHDFETSCLTNAIGNAGEPGIRVMRKRRTTYIDERVLYLPMPLTESCAGVVCGADQTCVGGACESIDISADTLSDYSDELLFGDTNACFNVSHCLDHAAPATLIDGDDCTFELNVSDPNFESTSNHLNVRLVYSSFNTEVLDLDASEGFIIPDPAHPLRFQLAPNLCESNYKQGKILSVSASASCNAKRALQPICSSDLEQIQAGQLPAIADNSSSQCTVAEKLTPAPSALYVLMDRSQSMSEFFGESDMLTAMEAALENPVTAQTQIAFNYIPSNTPANECAPNNTYATPALGFGSVQDLRTQITASLRDASNVLSTDPDLHLDAALRADSSYQSLRSLTPPGASLSFNRRALLIVGNRDFASQCGGDSAAERASAALNNPEPIHTYTVTLPASGTTTANPVSDAASIAHAGGTHAFDVTQNPEDGAKALQEIVNELGSCLYEPPSIFTGTSPNDAAISYLNPITLERTTASFNAACEENASGVDGWNATANGAIRICGTPCDQLRETLTDVALYSAAQQITAPDVPVVASAGCDSN